VQKLGIEYLLATKERYPDNVAFVEGGSRVTYAELWLRVLALSRLVRSSVPGGAPTRRRFHRQIHRRDHPPSSPCS
jgi:hypothetical protein